MRTFKTILLVILIATLAALVVTVLQVALLKVHNPDSTAWMRMRVRQAREQGKTLQIRHTWIPMNQIPKVMQRAVIAAEDDGFYQHHGFDWDAMKKAMERNEKIGRVKRGGSTITQQLAKNLYLSPNRNYWRKAREAVITQLLEWFLSKDRILELYLNCIEFGPGIFGIEEAARYHFAVSARQLSVDQCCRLAAIIPSPLRYKPFGPYVSRRAANIQQIVTGNSETPQNSPSQTP
jgi:monofunctional biosynthetic peptidoglycan transglycosylase